MLTAVLETPRGVVLNGQTALADPEFSSFLRATLRNLHRRNAAMRKSVGMANFLNFLTEGFTVWGVTFQNWMPLVVAGFLVWIGFLNRYV